MPPFDPAALERRKLLLGGAAVIPLFSLTDTLAIGHFSIAAFSVRLLWASITLAVALAWPRADEPGQALLADGLALVTSAFFCLLVGMTGGAASPLFQWILAMPLVVAVVVQEHPRATGLSALAMIGGGIWIEIRAQVGAAVVAEWCLQAAGLSALAFYGSVVYRGLRARERQLHRASLDAAEHSRALAIEQVARMHAEEAVRARDEFLSIASHELRTPLTSLVLHLDMLIRAAAATPEGSERFGIELHTARRQAVRLDELIGRLLDASRASSGDPALELQTTDLGLLVREVVQRLAPEAERSGVAVALAVEPGGVGRWDRSSVDQVVSNLLGNAFKYGAGRPVEVAVRSDGDDAVLTVSDHGIGVAPSDQERIFGRFERAVSGRHYGGLGLGLWLCRKLVLAHGGTIDVASRPGEGATFTLRLPKGEQKAAEPAALQ